jgi:hypothetical protein
VKLKPKSPAGKRRARRMAAEHQWRRFVERDIRNLATPCRRCGRIEYWGCVQSCWHQGTHAFAWAQPYRSPAFPLEVDGEAVRVHGDPNMAQETKDALAQVVRAVRAQYGDAALSLAEGQEEKVG